MRMTENVIREIRQILTAGPWGPTPPGNPLVPGSPWKQKTTGVSKTSEYVSRCSTHSGLQQCVKCASILSQDANTHGKMIKRQCCVLTGAPGLPLPYGRNRKAN